MTKNQMRQGAQNEDTLWLQFKFEDGDGDIGNLTPDKPDIFVKDSRTGNDTLDRFKIPDLPISQNDPQKGTVSIRIFTTCCIYKDGNSPCMPSSNHPIDSLQFLIFIVDRAGHQSNVIQSEFVKLQCI